MRYLGIALTLIIAGMVAYILGVMYTNVILALPH